MSGSIDALRDATSTDLEGIPFVEALRAGTVTRVGYVAYLRQLAVLHAFVERTVRDFARVAPGLATILAASPRPYSLLLDDLELFRLEVVRDVLEASKVGPRLVQTLMARLAMVPISLAGCIWALETLRFRDLPTERIAASLQLHDRRGVAFIDAARTPPHSATERFENALDEQLADPASLDAACQSAAEVHESVADALRLLEPIDAGSLGVHVTSLNPEGGDHPITQDPMEVEAALRATDHCFSMHGYFPDRFGMRGRRFTDSDGAYLLHLTDVDEGPRTERIEFVRKLMAARGMPSWHLQSYLELLADEATRRCPDRRARYDLLRAHARRIDAESRALIPLDAVHHLIDEFVRKTFDEREDSQARNLARVVVEAAVDEAQGHKKAVSSVCSWVADPKRFSPRWIEAVDQLVAAARGVAESP